MVPPEGFLDPEANADRNRARRRSPTATIDSRSTSVRHAGMQQITESDLRFILKFELGRLSVTTFKNAASGHQDTRARALETMADRLMKRMADWEILVPDPSGPLGSPPNWKGER